MARKLRLEAEGGLYHVINRGNYRGDIFRGQKTREAFLQCLHEACGKTGWRVHAWCVMSNHYHLALETPQRNLVEGMRWLQGTFSMRFNRLRGENGHLFQGRYKSLIVDGDGLGALCHYIHLNPVRAKLCRVEDLGKSTSTSFQWLQNPRKRASWYRAEAALAHAGQLADTAAGRAKYTKYLAWLSEDEAARKELNFEKMSKGWAIGTKEFKKALLIDHREAASVQRSEGSDLAELRNAIWEEALARLLQGINHRRADLAKGGKSVPWKIALGAALKTQTTATNRWLAEQLHLGHRDEVSRKINLWLRKPDPKLARRLGITPSPKI